MDRKSQIKELIQTTPAFNFVERQLWECRCQRSGDLLSFFQSAPLPPTGFIIMSAYGTSLTVNDSDLTFRVGLSSEKIVTKNGMNRADPFFRYFRYDDAAPSAFTMPAVGGFEYTHLNQLVVKPRLRIVVEANPQAVCTFDVVFGLLIHKLDPRLLDLITELESV